VRVEAEIGGNGARAGAASVILIHGRSFSGFHKLPDIMSGARISRRSESNIRRGGGLGAHDGEGIEFARIASFRGGERADDPC
jgi:hypothetical protein